MAKYTQHFLVLHLRTNNDFADFTNNTSRLSRNQEDCILLCFLNAFIFFHHS